MRFFTARRLALAAIVPALLVLSVIPGCSQQGEGEHCGDSFGTAANDDCASGLVCTRWQDLLNATLDQNRCCNPTRVTDVRCTPKLSGPTGSSGAGGASAGTGGGSSDAGASIAEPAGAGGV